VRYLAGFGVGVRYGAHCSNLINLARGIVERVFYVVRDGALVKAPQPRRGVFSRLQGVRKRLLGVLHPTPIVAREEYSGLYTGRKRGVYERAFESLTIRAINLRDAWVSTFVKAEKINFSSKGDPAPRVIQPRSPRYNLEVGRYLKLFEKELCDGFRRVFGYKVILKGLNAQDVGAALHEHWCVFDQPVAIGLDASRFDQHVSVEALKWEHSIYNAVFKSPELRRLLSWQLSNTGIARVEDYVVRYTIDGCRMSGDINTGLGNCLIMSSMVIAYCESVGIKFRLANNGDDCVLFVDQSDLLKLAGIDDWMLDFGFTLTREEPVFELEQVVFCQAQPVHTASGWRMVRDPRTAMSKDCVTLKQWDDPKSFKLWATSIGKCGLSLTQGVPVWEAWYKRLIALGCGEESQGVDEDTWDSGMGYMSRGVPPCEISQDCRYSFYKAFGILPDLQEDLEAEYSQPVILDAPAPMIPPESQAIDRYFNPLALWLVTRR